MYFEHARCQLGRRGSKKEMFQVTLYCGPPGQLAWQHYERHSEKKDKQSKHIYFLLIAVTLLTWGLIIFDQ